MKFCKIWSALSSWFAPSSFINIKIYAYMREICYDVLSSRLPTSWVSPERLLFVYRPHPARQLHPKVWGLWRSGVGVVCTWEVPGMGRQCPGGKQVATRHILTNFSQICINFYVNEARRRKPGTKFYRLFFYRQARIGCQLILRHCDRGIILYCLSQMSWC